MIEFLSNPAIITAIIGIITTIGGWLYGARTKNAEAGKVEAEANKMRRETDQAQRTAFREDIDYYRGQIKDLREAGDVLADKVEAEAKERLEAQHRYYVTKSFIDKIIAKVMIEGSEDTVQKVASVIDEYTELVDKFNLTPLGIIPTDATEVISTLDTDEMKAAREIIERR